MNSIKQPKTIIFGTNSAKDFVFPDNCLIITSSGTKKRGFIDHLELKNYQIFDKVESNPSIQTTEKILANFSSNDFSSIIGIGGGSSLDVAKYVAFKMKKLKFLVPTTFGSGSEVTKISVLKIEGKKKSFHDDGLFADVSIIDPYFLENCSETIKKNSFVDASAQCTEAYDSKNSNVYTKFLCKNAFNLLEDGFFTENYEKIALGSLISGLGFGNSSTTLGHALSYVYSNEGYSHGHALAFTTTIAHKFNKSEFFKRFFNIIQKLEIKKISLKQKISEAVETIFDDRKHLDNNPKIITRDDLTFLLEQIEFNYSNYIKTD